MTLLGFLLAVALGLPIALMRLYGPAPLRWLALSYVEFFRGIPILLLLVFLYFGLPAVSEYYDLPLTLRLNRRDGPEKTQVTVSRKADSTKVQVITNVRASRHSPLATTRMTSGSYS